MLPIYIATIVVVLCALALTVHVARALWRLTRPTPREPAVPVGYRENAQATEEDVGDDLEARIQWAAIHALAHEPGATGLCADPTCSGIPRPRAPRPGPAPRPISE